ncbi:MAG: putative RNA methyltransferase [Chitinophagales bacterium]|nr:MAG: putative RNA methyltransferase [Chitinophagales bacterium]
MLLKNLEIKGVEVHGRGVARHNGKVVFVDDALPGEVVDARIYRKKKHYGFARPEAWLLTSPKRQKPFCTHFGVCGGCVWQHVAYDSQLEFKKQLVIDAFQHIGKLTLPSVPPVLACSRTTHYRNKLEFTFSDKGWLTEEELRLGIPFSSALGFHKAGHFDKVIDIRQCYLQKEPSNAIRLALRNFALQQHMPFFNIRKQEGFLRNLIIRTSATDELMVIVSFFRNDRPAIEKVMDFLGNTFPQITSLYYTVNTKANDDLSDCELVLYHGNPYICEKLGQLTFHIGPKSFFQVNVEQALKLFEHALRFAGLTGRELVYDLYSGIGAISLFVAPYCNRVIGIEQLPEAVGEARHNAAVNAISNCAFYAADVAGLLSAEFVQTHGHPDVLFIDPPRAGLHPRIIKTLRELQVEKLVYVSCNPATQARDVAALSDLYAITDIQPVDMFPQTSHIENVVSLKHIHK